MAKGGHNLAKVTYLCRVNYPANFLEQLVRFETVNENTKSNCRAKATTTRNGRVYYWDGLNLD